MEKLAGKEVVFFECDLLNARAPGSARVGQGGRPGRRSSCRGAGRVVCYTRCVTPERFPLAVFDVGS